MFITFDLCDFFFVVLSVIRKQFLKKTELLQVDQSVLVDQILNKQCHQHRILGVESQMSLLQNINSDKEQGETAVFAGYVSVYLPGNIMFLNKRQEQRKLQRS